MGTPVKMTCILAESEHKLSGTCAATNTSEDRTPRPLTGKATEQGLGWRFDSAYEGQSITVSMAATLDAAGNKMHGTIAVAPLDADGTFLAVKQ
jgi:hypothetical protein